MLSLTRDSSAPVAASSLRSCSPPPSPPSPPGPASRASSAVAPPSCRSILRQVPRCAESRGNSGSSYVAAALFVFRHLKDQRTENGTKELHILYHCKPGQLFCRSPFSSICRAVSSRRFSLVGLDLQLVPAPYALIRISDPCPLLLPLYQRPSLGSEKPHPWARDKPALRCCARETPLKASQTTSAQLSHDSSMDFR
ncbi:unnamed protein product [Arctogadus glacialis]